MQGWFFASSFRHVRGWQTDNLTGEARPVPTISAHADFPCTNIILSLVLCDVPAARGISLMPVFTDVVLLASLSNLIRPNSQPQNSPPTQIRRQTLKIQPVRVVQRRPTPSLSPWPQSNFLHIPTARTATTL